MWSSFRFLKCHKGKIQRIIAKPESFSPVSLSEEHLEAKVDQLLQIPFSSLILKHCWPLPHCLHLWFFQNFPSELLWPLTFIMASTSITTIGGVMVVTQVIPKDDGSIQLQNASSSTAPAPPPVKKTTPIPVKMNDITVAFMRGQPHALGVSVWTLTIIFIATKHRHKHVFTVRATYTSWWCHHLWPTRINFPDSF